MSYFDDASLVFIPSGTKTSKAYSVKPIDGTGDLTFSRSNDTASRVASNGLIERVRTNLVLQSNTFTNAAWFTSGATITAGQPDPFGGNNAFLVDFSGATTDAVSQNVSMVSGTPYTLSIWIKGVDLTALRFNVGANLVVVTSQITNGTWVRVSASATAGSTASLINGIRAGNSLGESFFIYGAQLETGDIATDYIATTSAAVSVGPVANIPRLDYLNSSCPRLLLEGQRTNSFQFSESFGNAYWTKQTCVVTENTTQTLDPSGYNGADFVVTDNGAASGVIQRIETITASQPLTLSVFLKYQGVPIASINCRDNATAGNNAGVSFNIQTGVISTAAAAAGTCSNASATITNYGNGWYRCTLTFTNSATTSFRLRWFNDGVGNGVNGTFAWGFQLEQNASYASSYIPTLGAAVTRGADAASKTGISSLIGQTEGVLFVDFVPNNTPASGVQQWLFFLGSGSAYIAIFISSGQKLRANVANTTDQAVIDTSFNLVAGTRYKAALAYKENDFAFYVNGVQIGIDASGTVPALSTLQNNYNTTAANSSNAGLNQALLFKTRLPNAQLAELTSL